MNLIIINIFHNFINYPKLRLNIFIGHLESTEIDSDKIAAT
jgi:hypothetical protein